MVIVEKSLECQNFNMHEVFRLWLILLITLNTAVSEDTQQEILKDQEILRKLKQKKLVTIVMVGRR